jgi:catechol-2,3-dioxygenase
VSLQHLHLHVADRARAETFYISWFGMNVQRRGSEITFMNDERDFLLALMHDPAAASLPPWFHFGFKLPSATAVLELNVRMAASGVVIRKPVYQDESLVSYRCADPDGHVIEVYWESPSTS